MSWYRHHGAGGVLLLLFLLLLHAPRGRCSPTTVGEDGCRPPATVGGLRYERSRWRSDAPDAVIRAGDVILYSCSAMMWFPFNFDGTTIVSAARCDADTLELVPPSIPTCLPRIPPNASEPPSPPVVCYVCSCEDADVDDDADCDLRVAVPGSCGTTHDGTVPTRNEDDSNDALTCMDAQVTAVPAEALTVRLRAQFGHECVTNEHWPTAVETLTFTIATQACVPEDRVTVSLEAPRCGQLRRHPLAPDSVKVEAAVVFPLVPAFAGKTGGEMNEMLAAELVRLSSSDPDGIFGVVLGHASAVTATVTREPTVMSIFCVPCGDGDECAGVAIDSNPCDEGRRPLVPSQTVSRRIDPLVSLPPDIDSVVRRVAVDEMGVQGPILPDSLLLSIGLRLTVGMESFRASQDAQLRFTTTLASSLTEFYAMRGHTVRPGDVGVRLRGIAVTGATRRRRLLSEQDVSVIDVSVGVSILFPFETIDASFVQQEGVAGLLDAADVEDVGDAAAANARLNLVPAVLSFFARGEGISFDPALVASTTSNEPVVGGRTLVRRVFSSSCSDGFYTVEVPCGRKIDAIEDLGLRFDDELDNAPRIQAEILSRVSGDGALCEPELGDDGVIKAGVAVGTDTRLAVCRGGTTSLFLQTSRQQGVVDVAMLDVPPLPPTSASAFQDERIASASAIDAASLLNVKREMGTPSLVSWSMHSLHSMCTSWRGVSCDALGRVQRLRLVDHELAGDVRSLSWLRHLKELEAVDIASDALTGDALHLMQTLREVPNLRELAVAAAAVEGDIAGVSQLALLRRLSLHLPSGRGDLGMIAPLAALEHLSIASNAVSGNLTSLLALPRLRMLHLVGPMVGDAMALSLDAPNLQSVSTLGRGFASSFPGADELAATLHDGVLLPPTLTDDRACATDVNPYCSALLTSSLRECIADTALGRRLREVCAGSCSGERRCDDFVTDAKKSAASSTSD